MTIERQVPSRETCGRLRDAGFPQEGAYFEWWTFTAMSGEVEYFIWDQTQQSDYEGARSVKVCAAPLVSELMEVLAGLYPVRLCVHMQRDKAILSIAALESATIFDPPTEVRRENPAEALALLWLRVKEAP